MKLTTSLILLFLPFTTAESDVRADISTNNQANNFSVDGAGTVCGTVGTFKLASNAQMTLTIFKLQKQLDATQTHLDQTRVSGPGKVRGRTSLARVACFGIRR